MVTPVFQGQSSLLIPPLKGAGRAVVSDDPLRQAVESLCSSYPVKVAVTGRRTPVPSTRRDLDFSLYCGMAGSGLDLSGEVTELTLTNVPPGWTAAVVLQKLSEIAGFREKYPNFRVVAEENGFRILLCASSAGEVPAQFEPPPVTAPIFDTVTHHNQVLETWRAAAGLTEIATPGQTQENADPKVVIHFDSHSDLNTVFKAGNAPTIANYLNQAVLDGTVSEIYWVLPEYARAGTPQSDSFWPAPDSFNFGGGPFLGTDQRDYTMFVYEEGTSFVRLPKTPLAEVKVHKVYADELPDFSAEERSLYLDVDADYFSNTGYGSVAGYNPTEEELAFGLAGFDRALATKHIRPQVFTLSASPFYTACEDIDPILRYFGRTPNTEFIPNTSDAYLLRSDYDIEFLLIKAVSDSLNSGQYVAAIEADLRRFGFNDVADVYRDWGQVNADLYPAEKAAKAETLSHLVDVVQARFPILYGLDPAPASSIPLYQY